MKAKIVIKSEKRIYDLKDIVFLDFNSEKKEVTLWQKDEPKTDVIRDVDYVQMWED